LRLALLYLVGGVLGCLILRQRLASPTRRKFAAI
jgi:hypothetical protein